MSMRISCNIHMPPARYHKKCSPSRCLNKRKKSMKCRFAILRRKSMTTRCSQLIDFLSGQVVAKNVIDGPPDKPRKDWPLQTTNPRALTVDLKRRGDNDQMQPEASRVVTANMRCNTCHQFLGTHDQARSSGYYAVKYCGKNPVKANVITPVLHIVVSSVLRCIPAQGGSCEPVLHLYV